MNEIFISTDTSEIRVDVTSEPDVSPTPTPSPKLNNKPLFNRRRFSIFLISLICIIIACNAVVALYVLEVKKGATTGDTRIEQLRASLFPYTILTKSQTLSDWETKKYDYREIINKIRTIIALHDLHIQQVTIDEQGQGQIFGNSNNDQFPLSMAAKIEDTLSDYDIFSNVALITATGAEDGQQFQLTFQLASPKLTTTIPLLTTKEATPLPDLDTPPAPTNLVATAQVTKNRGQISLSWDPVISEGLKGYSIFLGRANNQFDYLGSTHGHDYQLTVDDIDAKYYLMIKAENFNDTLSPGSNVVEIIPGDETPPPAPTNVQVITESIPAEFDGQPLATRITLTWDPVIASDLLHYQIYSGFDTDQLELIDTTSDTRYVYTPVGSVPTYHVILAQDASGNLSAPPTNTTPPPASPAETESTDEATDETTVNPTTPTHE